MKRIFASFLIILFFCTSLSTKSFSYSSDPETFISEIIEQAKLILNSKDPKDIKAEKLSVIALKTVDVKGIGYYTLGKKRKEITPDQLKSYESLFEDYFQYLYLKNILVSYDP